MYRAMSSTPLQPTPVLMPYTTIVQYLTPKIDIDTIHRAYSFLPVAHGIVCAFVFMCAYI